MKLATATLLAGEVMVEREGVGKVPGLRASMPQSTGQKESGWQYGFRHPVGYISQRTLSGFPSAGHMGHGKMGAPAVPKAVRHAQPRPHVSRVAKPPHMPKMPSPSVRSLSRPSGHFKPSPSMHMPKGPKMPKVSRMTLSRSEAQEPPVGAYSKQNTHETKEWFEEKPIKAYGTSEGSQKGWDTRGRGGSNDWQDPYNPNWTKEQQEHWKQNAHGTMQPMIWNPAQKKEVEETQHGMPHNQAMHVWMEPKEDSWHTKMPKGIDQNTLKVLEENFGYKPELFSKGGPGSAKVGMQTPKDPDGNWEEMKQQATGRSKGSKTQTDALGRDSKKLQNEFANKKYEERKKVTFTPLKEKVKHALDGVGTSEGAKKGWDARHVWMEHPTQGVYSIKGKTGTEDHDDLPAYEKAVNEYMDRGSIGRDPEDFPRGYAFVNKAAKTVKITNYDGGESTSNEVHKHFQKLYPGYRTIDDYGNTPWKAAGAKKNNHALDADMDGEPGGPAMQHMHIQPVDTYHPPSLVKRKKQTHVPVDDVGETDDKWLDVTKRNSKDTWEQRMKMLKRSAPGGSPAQIPARTTLIPEHSGIWLPTSMMSAEKKPRLIQRPVNWDKQARQRTSYARRGCI